MKMASLTAQIQGQDPYLITIMIASLTALFNEEHPGKYLAATIVANLTTWVPAEDGVEHLIATIMANSISNHTNPNLVPPLIMTCLTA